MKLHTLITFVSILIFSDAALAVDADCRNPKTQADMTQCASSDLDRETNKINKTYATVRAKANPKQQQELKNVQLAWIKFKDLACKFEASGVEGGSAYSMVTSNCLIAKTRQRNKELEVLADCHEGDVSCPVW